MADTDLIERLTWWFTDWNGARMVPGEPPRDGIHCDILMEAATALAEKDARIVELEAEGDRLEQACLNQGKQITYLISNLTASRAECEGLRAALGDAADRFDEIRVILIEHLEEPQRTAFWKAVNGREFCRHALSQKETGDAT